VLATVAHDRAGDRRGARDGVLNSGILKRTGLGKLSRLEPLEPPNRYERTKPGELLHIDVKKLGRIGPKGPGHRVSGKRHTNKHSIDAAGRDRHQVGWEFVHVCVDDYTRLAYAQVMADEKATSAVAFLRSATAFYAGHGITVEAVLTDNGSAYISVIHAVACRALGIKHLRTRPRRPRPTAKPNASSARCCANGPTPLSTPALTNAPQRSTAGSSATTPQDHTAASAKRPRSAD